MNIKIEQISVQILEEPIIQKNKINKGAILLSLVDEIKKMFPSLWDYFYIIEWRGWKGMNISEYADIKLIEDSSVIEETKKRFPDKICLDVALGDFVDTDIFKPLSVKKIYTGIQIACWKKYKRHDLFVRAASLLPEFKFIKFGHFQREGNLEEILLKEKTIKLSRKLNANINFPFINLKTNKGLPYSASEINYYINLAEMGILTSKEEGMNRFKMECLSANIPFLVPKDACFPIKKHINKETGIEFDPTPKGLVEAIIYVKSNLDLFRPREYIVKNTGKKNSLKKLKDALNFLAIKDGCLPHYDNIDIDCRNQGFYWGEKALKFFYTTLESLKYQTLKYKNKLKK